MSYEKDIERIATLLRWSGKTLALTGAGISTESGIPDYRSPGTGRWTKENPMEVASVEALYRDPEAYYRRAIPRWLTWADCEPNAGHHALVRLEEMGYLAGVITQNVDSLHKRAGSKQVWEVHGHLRTFYCLRCRHEETFDQVVEQFNAGTVPPCCPACGGLVRPVAVLFGDQMHPDYFAALEALAGCQLLLVIGTSLQVYPVADLPGRVPRFVIINRDPTPWDDRAEVVVRESIGRVLTDVVNLLLATR
ncbi:NAD-dependent deacetylase [Desulfofundulus luciae]|uniref:protein acetyllysine N-acetyltransferase n=1 Tax=Desulfofundulus luciae TaxID=74702 RepID=A0ABU0B422_9FIRM|nr:NAD-dependent deacylase [Desulfofundulus luciae]MDQ0287017.1 NAD-dependent deacetylase [Desulfofundulus luciae]